uniref:LemA family protein n=1 Tax=Pararhizobium sp. IMCC3301 TaxID=3067904 RepID=UPI0027424B82|nr:LemA family protein [Pararhizobium sp. IMCC3301]
MDLLLIGLVVVVGLYLIVSYNGLVKARQMAKEAWSGIDVQLKRRANLIPNLVETVKGYATHEMETFSWVTELRARAGQVDDDDVSGRAQSEAMLGDALVKLMAVAEAYPELKANQNFQDLQQQLSEIEGEIQMSRRYYNGAARALNVKVESFPSNLIANNFGFAQMDYFEIENATDRAVPEVSF